MDDKRNVFFMNDKSYRTQMAIHYFVVCCGHKLVVTTQLDSLLYSLLQKPLNKYKINEIDLSRSNGASSWQEDSKIAFRKTFKQGIRNEYNHLLPTTKYKEFKVCFEF